MSPSRAVLLASVALAPWALVQPAAAAVHRFHDDHVLGTSMDFAVVGTDAQTAARALSAGRREIARLDGVLSGWRTDSELAQLNAADGPFTASADLFQVIARCEAFRRESGAAFSPRMGEVEAAWRAAARDGVPPDAARLRALAVRAEQAPVRLDPVARTIDRAGVTFAVDALAKGHVIDAALEAAARAAPAATGLMLDIGGDLRCRGEAPDPAGWRIGLAEGAHADNRAPGAAIRVRDAAVATSGPGARDLRVGDARVGHTLSPGSGAPAPARTVTVVAATAADADALATSLAVMPVADGLALAETMGAHARIAAPGEETLTTAGWSDIALPVATPAPAARLIRTAAAAASAAWPAGFQLQVDYEIPSINTGRRAHAPFVAIWITDERGRLVRTLYHLGDHPRRYLDSNFVWWRAFDADGRGAERLESVTRPSRPPGRYTAVWDGRDDAGAPVGQGRYVVNIEMTREHGGHSLQTLPIELGRNPASAAAPAQDESGPASVHYGRPAV